MGYSFGIRLYLFFFFFLVIYLCLNFPYIYGVTLSIFRSDLKWWKQKKDSSGLETRIANFYVGF